MGEKKYGLSLKTASTARPGTARGGARLQAHRVRLCHEYGCGHGARRACPAPAQCRM